MVAMFGLIMPAPLLIPVIVTLWLPTCNVTDAALGCVSVVIMDSAAKNQLSSLRLAIACGNLDTKRSTGKGSKITPVENGKICEASQPSNSASAAQVALAAANPASPVPALAFPVLTTSARIGPAAMCKPSRCALHTCTGAAQKRLVVNTPETVAVGANSMTNTSLRFALRIPASA